MASRKTAVVSLDSAAHQWRDWAGSRRSTEWRDMQYISRIDQACGRSLL